MTISEYKVDENTNKESIISTFEGTEEFDLHEYIMENLFIMTQNLSNPNENIVLETLKWFRSTFYHIYYVLPPDLIIKIFNLINSSNEFISKEAFKVVLWAVSNESNMQIVLLENGLLSYIMSNFPEKGTLSLCYQLTARSKLSRQILIQNDYLEKLRSLRDPESTFSLANQLHSLVNLSLHDIEVNLLSEIFDLFEALWSNLEYDDRKYSRLITDATHMLLKSNIHFLYAFMQMEIFHQFIEIPENLNPNDEPYLSTVFNLLTFIINKNEQFATLLIDHGVLDLTEEIITDEDNLFPNASISVMNFLTDLIFYNPDQIENIYNRAIPHAVLDIFEDLDTTGGDLIDALSFIIVMMALASPKVFSLMSSIGCYTVVVQNVMSVEDLYWKWAIRVIFRGFAQGKDKENEINRQFLCEHDDLIKWLENLKNEKEYDVSSSALQLLMRIFPDYVDS